MKLTFKVDHIARNCPAGPHFEAGETYEVPDVWAAAFLGEGIAEEAKATFGKKKAKKDEE